MGDDYQPLQAHKVVLSSCSEYFKNVLLNSRKYPNPVLCVEGLSKAELNNVLDYVYNGEVQIKQDDLERFLTIAERFKLEGLNGQQTKMDITEDATEDCSLEKAVDPKDLLNGVTYYVNDLLQESILNSKKQFKNEEKMILFQSQNLSEQEVNVKLDQMFTLDNSGIFTCNFCSKNANKKVHMREHVEMHVEGLLFPCKLCDKAYKRRDSLRAHVRTHKTPN